VVRHFDHDPSIERRHGLTDGAIARTAFASPLIDEVTTGRITRSDWIERIGEVTGSPAAAAEWGCTPFHVDSQLIALTDELRTIGLTCAILTNGTDTITAEVSQSGLTAHFDPIFNSAEIGHAKPDRRAFAHVLDVLHLQAPQVFFTDDSPAKLIGADEIGMHTHHFTGISALRAALRRAGVPT
ncbi:MAG: HAD-IA family hydrolase, partial [Microbacterium sp.]|uniref:HAD-IA family hydrolase n=1 Tax=Microbacterium sp. TaxID=51671 RepID=UPI003BAF650F